MTIYAKAGERVTCENGHHICTVVADILKFQVPKGGEFTDWQQPEPAKGTPAANIKCTQCGAPWFRGGGAGGQYLHFEDGWR